MTTDLRACALALLLPGAAFSASPSPDPLELLRKASAGPTTAYEGHVTVTRWYGKGTRAEEANVFFLPPNSYRWEFLAPDGSPERSVVSDGSKEVLVLPLQKKVLMGDAVKSAPKQADTERDVALIIENYRITLAGADKRAGRAVWAVEISPLLPGKPAQKVWIDQETGALLEARRFRDKRSFAVVSRYTRFEPKKDFPDGFFEYRAEPGVKVDEHGLDPDYLSLEEMRRGAGRTFDFPQSLPGGFVFESGDIFNVHGHKVRQARYTDGLASLSLFQTDKRVRLPAGEASVESSLPPHPGDFGLTSSGHAYRFKRGRVHYLLLGDISKDLLQRAAGGVR
jgi:outer membrane lipoprotein-sorting protein